MKQLTGTVVHGEKVGRTLGFPTADIVLEDTSLKDGVYATQIKIGDSEEWLPSLTHIGAASTFGKTNRKIETHILDYSGDLYDKEITIQFVSTLRGTKKFDTIEDLIEAMEQDEQNAREIFKEKN